MKKYYYIGDFETLEKFDFECGEEYELEKMYVEDYYNGSKSVVIDEKTRKIFIACYRFTCNETNMFIKEIDQISKNKNWLLLLIMEIFVLVLGEMVMKLSYMKIK